ncbi:MAG: HAD-IA family hydrolase [Pseudonocardia sp.]|nr:HAD-IA family hydrolase [Pseudonocardia sp.]
MRPTTDARARLAELIAGAGALLLDFDGPVCHLFSGYPAREVASAVRRFAHEHGGDLTETRTDDPLVLLRVAYQRSPGFGRDVEAFVIEQETHAAGSAEPTAGAHDTIHAAHAAGVPVLVVSNNSERAIRGYLARHELTDAVSQVIGRPFARPEQMKPDPHLVSLALDMARVSPHAAVFVGDSITDILAGTAAGVRCIGYAKQTERAEGLADADADLVLDSMADVAAAFSRR